MQDWTSTEQYIRATIDNYATESAYKPVNSENPMIVLSGSVATLSSCYENHLIGVAIADEEENLHWAPTV